MGIFEKLFQKKYQPSGSFRHFPDIFSHKEKILAVLRKFPTPLFLADKSILLDRYQELQNALNKSWKQSQISYSFKTNYDIARSRIFQSQGAWAEVVSGYEYALARRLGYQGNQIVFNGPAKKDTDIVTAIRDGALIHIDNWTELKRLVRLKKFLPQSVRLGMRLRVYETSRFGFSLQNGEALAAAHFFRRQHLPFTSVHMHIGTDVDDSSLYERAAQYMALFVVEVEKYQRSKISCLDMGGGFPASGLPPYGKRQWSPKSVSIYIDKISDVLLRALPDVQKRTFIVEPGRWLVDDGIIFICRVADIKQGFQKQIILTNTTLTMLPLKWYRPQIIRVYSYDLDEKSGNEVKTVFFGSSCREDDIIFEGQLPRVMLGDYIIFFCVGAYNQSMGSDFIFEKPVTLFLQ